MATITTWRALLTLCTSLLILSISTCGGKNPSTPQPELTPSPHTEQTQPSLDELQLTDVLASIDAQPCPAGVDSDVWAELTAEVKRVLSERGGSQIMQHPPEGDHNRVTDLVLVDDGAGGYLLQWTYVNVGDYNQDGLVSVNDLIPVGQHYNATLGGTGWDDAQPADGNGDWMITLADIIPIGQNYMTRVGGYYVFGAPESTGPWTSSGVAEFPSAMGGSALIFSHPLTELGYRYYMVVAADSGGVEGADSDPVDTLPLFITPRFAVTPDAVFVDTPADVVFSIGVTDALGSPSAVELLEVDSSGSELAVLGEMLDDGSLASGDALAGDRIYGFKTSVESASEGAYHYRARVIHDPGGGQQELLSDIADVSFFAEIPEVRAQEILDQVEQIVEDLRGLIQSMPLDEALAQMAETLEADATITAAGASDDDTFCWTTAEGFECSVYFQPEDLLGGSGGASAAQSLAQPPIEQDYFKSIAESVKQASTASARMIGNRKVLILNCFPEQTHVMGAPAINDVLADCSRPEFVIDYFSGDDCSIERFKTMKDYGIIVIQSHGGLSGNWNPVIATRTEVTVGSLIANTLAMRSKMIEISFVASILPYRPTYSSFGIRPAFISTYCEGMPNSIVYIASCKSLANPPMGEAFLQAGAGAYYGYDDNVRGYFLHESGVSLFTDLAGGEDSLMALMPLHIGAVDWLGAVLAGKPPRTVALRLMGGGWDRTRPVALLAPTYAATDLGFLSETPGTSEALDINNNGAIVGHSHYDGHDHPTAVRAFIWEDASTGMVDLGTPSERHSKAYSINNSNQVAGEYDYTPIGGWLEYSYLWEGGQPVTLSTEMANLDPTPEGSTFNVIRNRARAVSEAFFYGSEKPEYPSISGTWGYLYDRNSVVNLFTVPEYRNLDHPFSDARDVNAWGVIVGTTGYRLDPLTTRSTAFKWQDGAMQLLPTPAETSSYARAVNQQVAVVGYLYGEATDDERRPAHWSISNQMTQLALLKDNESGVANDINDSGVIVGYSLDEGFLQNDVRHAVIWPHLDEPPLDLNWLIPSGAGIELIRANAINDAGQIVGMGSLTPGGYRAFLLTPTEDQ